MKWNNETGYIDYKSSLQSILTLLNISQIDYYLEKCELIPYITYILKYINKRLLLLNTEDIRILIQEVFDIHDKGADDIILGCTRNLIREIGIDEGDVWVENEEIPYNQDRFIYSWSNVLTALVTRLKLQYSYLLNQPISNDCPCECEPGQDTKDFENWTSGVYPEDESYSYYNYSDKNTGWRIGNDIPECTKCLRRY